MHQGRRLHSHCCATTSSSCLPTTPRWPLLRTQKLPVPSAPAPGEDTTLCLWEFASQKWNHTLFVILWLASFTSWIGVILEHNVLSRFLLVAAPVRISFPFRGWMIPGHTQTTGCGPFRSWRMLQLSHLLATMNNAALLNSGLLFWASNTWIWYKMQKGPKEETLKVYLLPPDSPAAPFPERNCCLQFSGWIMLKNFRSSTCVREIIYIYIYMFFFYFFPEIPVSWEKH